jgi:hypothetical protein
MKEKDTFRQKRWRRIKRRRRNKVAEEEAY